MMRAGRPANRSTLVGATIAVVGLAVCAPGQDKPALPGFSNQDSIKLSNEKLEHFHAADMPLSTALRMLSVKSRRNIVASPNVTGTVTANLFDVSLEEALRAILLSNGAGYLEEGGVIYVYTNNELAEIAAQQSPLAVRVFTLNYIKADDAAGAVEPLLSEHGKITRSAPSHVGLDVSGKSAGGDNLAGNEFLVVYDHPAPLERIGRVLAQLDVRPRQVLIEATILRARLTDDNALGVDFTLVAGVDLELLNSRSIGVQDIVLGQLPQDRFEQFNASAVTDFIDNLPDGGLQLGIIKDNVALFIKALEEITDTSVLANPKVLALNKQVGNVIVGRRDGYITTTVTETQAVQKVEFLETGTQLTFRPFIGTDGYVRVELHPEDSVGGLTPAQLPFEQTTEVTTNVIVRDGHTILIGGLFRELSSDSRAQVPLLGDIPGVGNLFRSRSDELDREEVIILLTVHIVKDEQAYADKSMEKFYQIERTRVGLRKGMMWHGRERLAQSFYRKALEYYERGDVDRARWHVQMALHNYPRFLEAIELKDEIEQSRAWEDDAAMSRAFIYELIRREQGLGGPVFDRPVRPFGEDQGDPGDARWERMEGEER